jgi:hypothetical protein
MLFLGRCWIQDTGYRIQDTGFRIRDALGMKSKNIQISVSSPRRARGLSLSKAVEPYPETRIQDQSILATAKFDYSILCNYRVNSDIGVDNT